MKRLWMLFAAVMIVSFAVLGWIGTRIYQEKPPLLERVVTTNGEVVIDAGEITAGQNVWQTLGGMQVGSVWGHGSYVAPDWTADWLHREAVFILDRWADEEHGSTYEKLSLELQAQLQGRLAEMMRENTYDAATGTVTISPVRAEAYAANVAHFSDVFSAGRTDYAIPAGAVTDPERLRRLSAFSLLDRLERHDESAERHHHLHAQLALRNRWSAIAPRARRSSGPESASSCYWPASRRWSGGTPRVLPKNRPRRFRRPIR